MNYRHAYHAGNFADVLKHAVLARAILRLTAKEAAFRVIDTHAGIGLYDLGSIHAEMTGEWKAGIGTLFDATGPLAIPLEVSELLRPFLEAVQQVNAKGTFTRYPGSPTIARSLLRRQDRLVLSELHPQDAGRLAEEFRGDQNVKVHALDGWLALKAFLPPKERRGLILIDPPFEARDEFMRLYRGLADAFARFSTGTYLAWYPIKDPRQILEFHKAIVETGVRKVLRVELLRRPPDDPEHLNGCGLLVFNPPWQLDADLAVILPFLSQRLGEDGRGSHRLDWLVDEAGQAGRL